MSSSISLAAIAFWLAIWNIARAPCGRRYYGDWYNFFLRKAEYVAMEDFDKCNGCRVCVSRCQFGAITYSPYLEKAIINMKKCAGCGLCRDTCPQNAIKLVLRAEFPAVGELW
ncbi:MAG: 4Fe-4S binding protein [Candidatus Bathyarchaeota archaeon]|nr:4Fe-4S binding protein [Candidatus Bathyarchaeota archaeon]